MTSISNIASASTSATQGSIASPADIQTGTLKSAMPLSEAWAPQLFAKGNVNGDSQLSENEFVNLMSNAAVSKEKALALFKSFGGTDTQGITLEQFFEGIKSSNASGDNVFSQLTSSILYSKQGTVDTSGMQEFLQAGASLAEQFWGSRS